MSKGTLYLIPTVISPDTQGQTISPQVLNILPKIDHFLVEEIRTSRRYISSLKLGITIENLKFEILNKKTRTGELRNFMKPLQKGIDMAVLSESGCPGIADPGALAVEMAHNMNIRVIPLVGPSSIFLTLMASGLNGQNFTFNGYLPIDIPSREKAIRELERESKKRNQTQLFMETPYRNEKMLASILKSCRSETLLCVSCDITGQSEWIKTMPISMWRKQNDIPIHKLPTVFAILA